jgi:hypothetical protein
MGLCLAELSRLGIFERIQGNRFRLSAIFQALIIVLIILHVSLWTTDHQTFIDKFYSLFVWNTRTQVPSFGIPNPIPFWYGPSLQISFIVLGIFILFELNPIARRIFQVYPFKVLGKYSFSLYIVHIRKCPNFRLCKRSRTQSHCAKVAGFGFRAG